MKHLCNTEYNTVSKDFCSIFFKFRERRGLPVSLSFMASSGRRRKDGHHPCFTSNTPHFFKIVLPHTLKEKKLEISRKFARKHGEGLEKNKVVLKVAGGAEWNVGLTKSNGSVWFENGWEDLVGFYSIKLGYFLMFRYEGSSCFNVIIFDHSASEIQYPLKKTRPRDDDDDEISCQALCFVSNKKMKTDQVCARSTICNSRKAVDKLSRTKEFSFEKELKIVKKFGNEALHCSNQESKDLVARRKQPLTPSEEERLMVKATTFKSMTLNPSFVVKMWPSYIHPGKCLTIPRRFAEIMHIKESADIILQVSDGRIWTVRCGVYCDGKKVELIGGWKRFVCDNNLQEGDVCVFELMETSTEILLKVAIFRP